MSFCTACGWDAAGPCRCERRRDLRLVSVYDPTCDTLIYELLQERAAESDPFVPKRNRAVKPFRSFRAWLRKRPIAHWYLVFIGKKVVGQVQLHEPHGPGIIIREQYRGKGYGLRAMRELMKLHPRLHWMAAIHPKNERSIRLFKKLGFVKNGQYYERSY